MFNRLASLAQPFLLKLDAERAHELGIEALKTGLVPRQTTPDPDSLRVRLWDLDFPNPLGMAPGFDKSAEVPDALLDAGFGFVEVGTLTPRPQDGNPKPRVFRLKRDGGVINRLGFNNDGHMAARLRLERRRGRKGIVGVNVGANKDTEDRAADYVAGIDRFADLAAFFTINISSPNTPGLRDLQHDAMLDDLLARCVAARDKQAETLRRRVPLLLKIAPDLDDADLDRIAGAVTKHAMDGVIVSNTTLDRSGLTETDVAREAGGLSGRPLFRRSTIQLARMRQRLPEMPLIGVGGIDTAETAYAKIRAGASLIELYTGLIYGGIGLVGEIKAGLAQRLAADGFKAVADAVGRDAEAWAQETI